MVWQHFSPPRPSLMAICRRRVSSSFAPSIIMVRISLVERSGKVGIFRMSTAQSPPPILFKLRFRGRAVAGSSRHRQKHYGVGRGFTCSDAGTRDGSGLSGEVCKCTAFHSAPTRLKTSVILPDPESGCPLKVCDCVQRHVTTAPSRPSIVTCQSRISSLTSLL